MSTKNKARLSDSDFILNCDIGFDVRIINKDENKTVGEIDAYDNDSDAYISTEFLFDKSNSTLSFMIDQQGFSHDMIQSNDIRVFAKSFFKAYYSVALEAILDQKNHINN